MNTPTLNRYFIDKVALDGDKNKELQNGAIPVLKDIVGTLAKIDPRFGRGLIPVGSYFQGLKIVKANEFDFNIPLNYLDELDWILTRSPPKYYGFNQDVNNDDVTVRNDLSLVRTKEPLKCPGNGYLLVNTPTTNGILKCYESLTYDGNLVPFLVKRELKTLLKLAIAVQPKRIQDRVTLSRTAHGPALTLTISVPSPTGTEEKVSIDIAPIIRVRWSFETIHANWPRPGSRWPSTEVQDSVRDKGVNWVAKHNFFWRYSFAEAEKELGRNTSGCRNTVHRLMKSFLQRVWCPSGKSELSTYVLKNTWLWECERTYNSAEWKDEYLVDRFNDCVSRLLGYLDRQIIHQYFYVKINLLEGKDKEKLSHIADMIRSFRVLDQCVNIGPAVREVSDMMTLFLRVVNDARDGKIVLEVAERVRALPMFRCRSQYVDLETLHCVESFHRVTAGLYR